MQRIAIIGSGGAGKSTLARQLGEVIGIEVVHLRSRRQVARFMKELRGGYAGVRFRS